MTSTMRKRRGPKLTPAPETCSRKQPNIRWVRCEGPAGGRWSDMFSGLVLYKCADRNWSRCCFRRETFITVPSSQLPQMEEEEEEADLRTPARPDSAHGEDEDWGQIIDHLSEEVKSVLFMWPKITDHKFASKVLQSVQDTTLSVLSSGKEKLLQKPFNREKRGKRMLLPHFKEQTQSLVLWVLLLNHMFLSLVKTVCVWIMLLFCVSEAPLLQTNGKLPMWFRKLVSSMFTV